MSSTVDVCGWEKTEENKLKIGRKWNMVGEEKYNKKKVVNRVGLASVL